jgi:ATP-dependent DNA helicase RecQ
MKRLKNSGLDIRQELKHYFGFDRFKAKQEEVIRSLLSGRNTFVLMPTGGGKSMCYQLPALMMDGTAIIISPLIALMKNQVDSIRAYFTDNSVAHVYNSTLSRPEQLKIQSDLKEKKTKLLYIAPESFSKTENQRLFQSIRVSFYAIDEAHCISEWGHDFRPEYRKIRNAIEAIRQKSPVLALTATATPKVRYDILKNLNIMDANIYVTSFDRPNLHYEIKEKTEKVDSEIVKFIKKRPAACGIIYCFCRKDVERLATYLQINNIKALPYHAGLEAETRTAHQDKFLSEEVHVVVATIAFGMGIDKPNVRFVIHYNMPKSLESYYQETGRAGRDDKDALCIAYYTVADINRLLHLARHKTHAEQEIVKQLLGEVSIYAESVLCRRKHLLHYFGEIYKIENCGSCDNCLREKYMEEGKEYICLLLNVIEELKQEFKEKHIVNVLVGNMVPDIKKYGHEKLETFACGETKSEHFWQLLIKQACLEHLLTDSADDNGVLKITKEGKKFIKKPHSIQIVSEKTAKEGDDDDDDDDDDDEMPDNAVPPKGGGVVDKALYQMLKDLLKSIAKKENLPPYVIFQEHSLEDMCIQYPTTMEEMTQVLGVGPGKAQKYGDAFIKLIRKYVEDNEIERPQDIIVKSVVSKSGIKVYIIQNIDRKIDLEDICIAKNLTMDELLDEIENIVTSGTKIDLDYYIDENIDSYHQEDIMEYLHESQEDDVEKALAELGEEEYTIDEIRLMRIKFLSDKGN